MRKILLSTVALMALVLATRSEKAMAASTTADAKQIVTSAITITKVSDLEFGSAAQGDAAKTVAPGAAENAENASFTVAGAPNTAYTVTLPANGTVTMQTGAGGANETIAVSAFTSFPATSGMISAGGSQLLLVGAQRAALGASQVAGSYTASFTVAVVY